MSLLRIYGAGGIFNETTIFQAKGTEKLYSRINPGSSEKICSKFSKSLAVGGTLAPY